MEYILIVVGLGILIFGGDFLVKGASGLAMRFKMPPMLIGMTVVAMGTSAPELVVTVQAALAGKPDIAIGNVVGSNIANVALILGITIIIFPITIKKDSLKFDWVVMMLASLLFFIFALDGGISRLEGLIFLFGLITFIIYSFYRVRTKQKKGIAIPFEAQSKPRRLIVYLFFVVVGILGLVFGARWFLEGAEAIARNIGVSDRVIAVSLVAFGTSVPELATSVIAAFKKEQDISLGNIIGSNLFNILAILGITSLISPISVAPEIMKDDIYWMLATSFVILPLGIYKLRLGRWQGVLLLTSYIVFMYFVLSS